MKMRCKQAVGLHPNEARSSLSSGSSGNALGGQSLLALAAFSMKKPRPAMAGLGFSLKVIGARKLRKHIFQRHKHIKYTNTPYPPKDGSKGSVKPLYIFFLKYIGRGQVINVHF